MSFTDFLQNSWQTHADQPRAVADAIEGQISSLRGNDDILGACRLIVHVYGEHLGDWDGGLRILEMISRLTFCQGESLSAVNRSRASLSLGKDDSSLLQGLAPSDRAQALVTAAAAVVARGSVDQARKWTEEAASMISTLEQRDPSNRTAAVCANNIASQLEDQLAKQSPNSQGRDLMIFCAYLARKQWAIAGGWLEIERAEYRLAKTHIVANLLDKALFHALLCLEICAKNNAEALEFFFAHEALAKTFRALGRPQESQQCIARMVEYFEKLSSQDQGWCRSTLESLSSPSTS